MSNPALLLAAQAIDVLAGTTVIAVETDVGGYVDGRWVSTWVVSGGSISATVYAMSTKRRGELIQRKPDATEYTELLSVHTRESIQASDTIIYLGERYVIVERNRRVEGGFTRLIIGRTDGRENTV